MFVCLVPAVSFAQLEHKATAYISIGMPFIKSAGPIAGENIYYGYKPIPYLGLGLQYNRSTHFSIGAVLRQLVTSKANYNLSHTTIGLTMKYNFLPSDKKVSPFGILELSTGYLYLSQKANNTVEKPIVVNPEHVAITEQEKSYPEIKRGFSSFGVMLGVGIDFTLNLKYGMFVSANYFLSDAHKSAVMETHFEQNTSKFRFLMLQTGIRFSFGKSKSVY